MLTRVQIAYLKIVVAMFLWGATYHAAKELVQELDIYTSSAIRWGIAALVLVIMFYQKKSLRGFIQPFRNWIIILAIGIFAIGVYNIFFFAAEARIPANLVAVIIAITPCITVICSRVFFKEAINFLTLIGIVIAFCGAVLVINVSGCGNLWCNNLIINLNFGELLAFLMAICAVAYNLLLKKSARLGMDGLTVTTLSSLVGAVFLIIVAGLKGKYLTIMNLSNHAWWMIFYLAIFGSVLGYKWYSDGVKEIKVSQAVVFVNTIPLTSIITGILFFNSPVTYLFVMAALIVIAGVIITNYSLINKKKI